MLGPFPLSPLALYPSATKVFCQENFGLNLCSLTGAWVDAEPSTRAVRLWAGTMSSRLGAVALGVHLEQHA